MRFIVTCLAMVVLVGCASHSHQQPQAVIQPESSPAPLLYHHTTVVVTNAVVVYVSGAVTHPGHYDWFDGMTVLDAIKAAGGFTDFAGPRLKISHADGTSIFVDRGGDTSLPLKTSDLISVPRRIL